MNRKLLALTVITALFAGCGQKTDNDLYAETQECLNKAAESEALSCVSGIMGKSDPAANLLICAAYFKDQGIGEPARLAQISNYMSSGGGDAAAINMMTFLAFSSSRYTVNGNYDLVRAAANYCNASGSKGFVILASLSKVATATLAVTGTLTPGVTPSPQQLQAALCDPHSAAPKDVLGEAAIAAYNSGCIGTNGIATNPFCDAIKSANLNATDPVAVGTALQDNLCVP